MMKGFHGKVESDKKRDCKITILVSRSDRDRIIKAARADGDRTVSDIGMEYLLKYAEMVENREGVKVYSMPSTERVQREIRPLPIEPTGDEEIILEDQEPPLMPPENTVRLVHSNWEEDTEPEKSKEAVKEPIVDTKTTGPVEVPIVEDKPTEMALARDSGKTVRYKKLNENHRRKWTRVPVLIVPMSDEKREEIRRFIHDVLDEHKYGVEVEVLREKCRYTGGDLVYKDRYTIDEMMTVILSDEKISYHEDSSTIQYATTSARYERKDGEYEWKSCINGIKFTSSEAEINQARDFIKNLLAEKQTDMRICEIVFIGRDYGIQARPISDAIEAYRDSVFAVNTKNIVRLI